jgi:NADH-quinone oxidoreductase subunit F
VSATGTPLLPYVRATLADYRSAGGYDALHGGCSDRDTVVEALLATNLSGLGGAHFPFATKLRSALGNPGPRVVVCNAAEDEPGSQKDRTLLERNPHVVIEGALLAALALEADTVVFYVRANCKEPLTSLEAALAELALLPDISGLLPAIRIHAAPLAYVAGEASAAIRSIAGEDAKPAAQPPYPTDSGLDGRPTLVSNCETLANLPRVVRGEEPATRLVTVTGDVVGPGVYEVNPGITCFGDLIELAGGLVDPARSLKAIQPGGPSSAYLPASAVSTMLAADDIRAAGSQPGCLAVRVLDAGRCLVEEAALVTQFFAGEQCGQCPPCRMKTANYAGIMRKIAADEGTWALLGQFATIDEFVADMPRRCALIDMPTPAVASAVTHFRDDFADHIDRHKCGGNYPNNHNEME